jgi:hypothetical protein
MKRPASLIAAVILLLMATAQVIRLAFKIKVVAGGMKIPVWPSALASLVLASLALWLLTEREE